MHDSDEFHDLADDTADLFDSEVAEEAWQWAVEIDDDLRNEGFAW